MNLVDVVLANNDRVTVRVGETFLKIDADRSRAEAEVEAIAMAPTATPEVLWHKPPVLALAALQGQPLGRLGETSTASPAAWAAAGAAIRVLHDAPLPSRPGKQIDQLAARLAAACDWLVTNLTLPPDLVERNRQLAEAVPRPWQPAFIHGDLHLEHVFVDGDRVTGIIDWSEASQGDPLFDIASLTLANEEHLDDLINGYGADVDRDMVRAWWSFRSLVVIPWLAENGYGPPEDYPETAVLRSQFE